MVKGFYNMLIKWGLIGALFVLIVINMWQNDRMEAKQIKILSELKNMKRKIGTGGGGGAVMPSTAPSISKEDGNLLAEDKDPWLPEDAKQGGKLKMKFRSDPKGLNFLTENGTDVSTIQSYTHVGLIQRHKNNVKKYGPELATFYGRSDDYKTYTYKIRNDVFWHEPAIDNADGRFDWLFNGDSCKEGHFINGRCRVTAHDVVFMLDMLMNAQVAGAAPLRAYFKDLDTYEATSDFELKLTFKTKTYKNDLVSKWIYPIGEFLYGYDDEGEHFDEADIGTKFQDHWYNPKALGCGPYRFVEFKSGEYIKLERDPLYPMGGNSFDEILIQIVKDENQPARMLQNGDLHITTLSTPQYRKNLLEAKEDSPFKNGTIENGTFWGYGYTYIGWNADLPMFEDKRVRKAMSHAFNADLVLDEVYLNLGERTTGPLSTFLPHYNKSLEPIPFDLEKAKALLDEAGWIDSDGDGTRDKMVNGTKLNFSFEYTFVSGSSTNQTIGNIFKEDLNKIGVDMTLRPLEWASLLKKINAKEFQAIVLGWGSSPDVDFHQIWHSSQADIPKGSNRVGFRNQEADAIIKEMEMEFDMEKRIELAKKFHKLLYEEQPYTFLYTFKNPYFYSSDLKNAKTSLVRPYFNPRPWYLSAP